MPKLRQSWLFAILVGIITLYLALRAWWVPVTNDEAYTLLYFVQLNQLIPFFGAKWSANNHLLNTLLCSLTNKLGFDHIFWFRLPNVVAFSLFSYVMFKVGNLIKQRPLRWLFWGSLFSIQFLLDFFALARGYGLSIAFLFAGLYQTYLYIYTDQKWNFKASLLMALALTANLGLLNIYLICVTLPWLFTFKKSAKLAGILQTLLQLSVMVPFVLIALELKNQNQLYFGTQAGLLEQMGSLLTALFYIKSSFGEGIALVIFTAPTVMLLSLAIRNRSLLSTAKPFVLFTTLFSLNYLAHIIQWKIFGVNLPVERAFLLTLCLFTVSFFLALDVLFYKKPKLQWFVIPMSIFIFSQLFSWNINTVRNPNWKVQLIPQDYYTQMVIEQAKTDEPLHLESSILFNKHNYQFLNLSQGNALGTLGYREKIDSLSYADLLILEKEDQDKLNDNYSIIVESKANGTMLAKRQSNTKTELLFSEKNQESNCSDFPFLNLLSDSITILKSTNLLLYVNLKAEASNTPNHCPIVIEIRDSEQQLLQSEEVDVLFQKKNWQSKSIIQFKHCLYNVPASAKFVNVIWHNYTLPKINSYQSSVHVYTIH